MTLDSKSCGSNGDGNGDQVILTFLFLVVIFLCSVQQLRATSFITCFALPVWFDFIGHKDGSHVMSKKIWHSAVKT